MMADVEREVVIWGRMYGRRWKAGSSNAFYSPIPHGAIPIVRCCECDKKIMMKWIQKRLDRKWPIDKIRAACEA